MSKLMTEREFIRYAHEVTDGDALEPLYDTITQHNSEVSAFGDSWPGALYHIHRNIAEVKAIERQLARLEKRAPRDFRFSVRHPA